MRGDWLLIVMSVIGNAREVIRFTVLSELCVVLFESTSII